MGSVHLVDGAGRQIGGAVALPGVDGWYPTGVAGKAGMVLQQLPPYGNHRNQQEIWNPLTDRVVHVFANAYVLGTGGNSVVWETAVPYCRTNCPLHVLNALNGSERTVQLPPGVTATGDVAISPDGRTIAVTVALGYASRIPDPQAVLLIGPHTQVAKMLTGSEQSTNPNLGPMSLTWSTNGWLFSSTVGKTTVEAWRPGESQARVLPKLRLPKFSACQRRPVADRIVIRSRRLRPYRPVAPQRIQFACPRTPVGGWCCGRASTISTDGVAKQFGRRPLGASNYRLHGAHAVDLLEPRDEDD